MKLKEIRKMGCRGYLFTYEFGDSVYLINTEDKLIICDTSEGRKEMEYVKQFIKDKDLLDKPLFIFNSHSDWDHIWGNDAFLNPYIIGHRTCRERMEERALFDLEVLSHLHDSNIEIKLPNITFNEKLVFEDDDVEFIYTPGHTICSATCYDRIDKVAYVGDLIEYPIPVINDLNFEGYIKSLESIKSLNPKTIITSHSKIVSHDLIDKHIDYLYDVISGKYLTFTNEFAPIRHTLNLKNIILLRFDEKIKKKYKDDFEYITYKIHLWNYISTRHNFHQKKIWDISELSVQDLKQDLEAYDENNQENLKFNKREVTRRGNWS